MLFSTHLTSFRVMHHIGDARSICIRLSVRNPLLSFFYFFLFEVCGVLIGVNRFDWLKCVVFYSSNSVYGNITF